MSTTKKKPAKPSQGELALEMVTGLKDWMSQKVSEQNTVNLEVLAALKRLSVRGEEEITKIRDQMQGFVNDSRRTATEYSEAQKPNPIEWHEVGTFQPEWNIKCDPEQMPIIKPGTKFKVHGLWLSIAGIYVAMVPNDIYDKLQGYTGPRTAFLRSDRRVTIKVGYPTN